MKVKISNANIPSWKEVTVKSRIPDELKKLAELSRNMWWAWNHEATDLFKSLNPDLWKEVGQNPVLLLERLSYEQLEQLAQDKVILKRMDAVYDNFSEYMSVKPDKSRPSVAYFCMEYGLNHVLKLYSGGLGILAGDYMKEASDSNVDMCGIGLLYRHGYFTQTLSMDGQQIANYETQNFGSLPIERVMDKDGQPLVVKVPYMNYWVYAYIWRVNIGRVPLYLMDTDNEMNSEFDRPITSQLYGGDWENRLKQEILLGIGGMLTLEALGIDLQKLTMRPGVGGVARDEDRYIPDKLDRVLIGIGLEIGELPMEEELQHGIDVDLILLLRPLALKRFRAPLSLRDDLGPVACQQKREREAVASHEPCRDVQEESIILVLKMLEKPWLLDEADTPAMQHMKMIAVCIVTIYALSATIFM